MLFFPLSNISETFSMSIEKHLRFSDYQVCSERKSMRYPLADVSNLLSTHCQSLGSHSFLLCGLTKVHFNGLSLDNSFHYEYNHHHVEGKQCLLISKTVTWCPSPLCLTLVPPWASEPSLQSLANSSWEKAEFLNKTIQIKTKPPASLDQLTPSHHTHKHKRKCAGEWGNTGGDKTDLDRAWKAFQQLWETISIGE